MIFIDQDGAIIDLSCSYCPRCLQAAEHADRVAGSGYFQCRCGLVYDEPDYSETSVLGYLEDEEA